VGIFTRTTDASSRPTDLLKGKTQITNGCSASPTFRATENRSTSGAKRRELVPLFKRGAKNPQQTACFNQRRKQVLVGIATLAAMERSGKASQGGEGAQRSPWKFGTDKLMKR